MPQPYSLPRPGHDWKPFKTSFSCRKCCCAKDNDVDTGHLSTGCTETPYAFFPGPNFQLAHYTWDQLDGTRSAHNGHYEPQSESGATPVPAPAPAWAKTPAPIAAKPDWKGDFEIGDRVMIDGECEGTIVAFNVTSKFIEVLRDDGQEGSGSNVFSLKHGKYLDTWSCDKGELTLLDSGTTLHVQNLPKEEPHKMGLDPETIDWSKFKKIRDML